MDTERDAPDPRLAAAIAQLRDTPPAVDLWPAIAPRLNMRQPKGTVLVRWPTALAAGIAIAVISVGGTVTLLKRNTVAAPTTAAQIIDVAFAPADVTLEVAIRDLLTALRPQLAKLDAPAQTSIAKSLAALDQAIAEAAAACRAAPSNTATARYLTSTLRKKFDVLRSVSEQLTKRA